MQTYDSDNKKHQIKEVLDYYKSLPDRADQEVIVSMLRELQEICGCISPDTLEAAAGTASVKLSTMQAIVKRYPSLKLSPYVHEITVCIGKNCGSRGNLELLSEMKRRLKTDKDGISGDKRVCLKTRPCLKQCRTAPNVMVDGTVYSAINADELMKLVSK